MMHDHPGSEQHDGLSSVGQVGITVRGLAAAVPFYRDQLGLTLLFEAPGMAFFRCGELRLMLSEPESADAPQYSSIIYFRVDDIGTAHERLAARGVPFLRAPHCVHRANSVETWMAFLHDPGKNVLALMEERRVAL
jgi:predicted enzyme related to lactoylglutathione lyase